MARSIENLESLQGSTWERTWNLWEDEAKSIPWGTTEDPNDWAARAEIRSNFGASLIQVISVTLAGQVLTLRLEATETAAMPAATPSTTYRYDVELVKNDGTVIRGPEGTITHYPEITTGNP